MLLSGDEGGFFSDEIVDCFIFDKIKQLFVTWVSFPVRKSPVTLSFYRHDEKTQNNTKLCCLTCGQNIFFDDPVILNFRLSTGGENACEYLIDFRNYIIDLATGYFLVQYWLQIRC